MNLSIIFMILENIFICIFVVNLNKTNSSIFVVQKYVSTRHYLRHYLISINVYMNIVYICFCLSVGLSLCLRVSI